MHALSLLFLVCALASCGGGEREGAGQSGPSSFVDALRLERASDRRQPTTSGVEGKGQAEELSETMITVSAVGDCALGDLRDGAGAPGSFSAELALQSDPMAYPFSGVSSVLAGDDLTIANLEGALTNRRTPITDGLAIRGRPDYAAILTRGHVELVGLANNHSSDYGLRGLRDTRRSLEQHGISHFGFGTIDRRVIRGVLVVNLGYIGGRDRTLIRMVRDIERESKTAAIVIVSLHWGLELVDVPDMVQRRLGRAAVRAGADLVLGHHPHVLQGIETYRGRHIVYSLGNFVFGANSQPRHTQSMIYQEQFFLEQGRLKRVEGRVLPVRISSTTHRNDFRPQLLEGHERTRLLARLDRLSAALAR
ncbi:MAG: CapA family protein [Polyangiaceae bacterium]